MGQTDKFEDVTDEGILSLIENRDSNNTENVIKGTLRILSSFAEVKGTSLS